MHDGCNRKAEHQLQIGYCDQYLNSGQRRLQRFDNWNIGEELSAGIKSRSRSNTGSGRLYMNEQTVYPSKQARMLEQALRISEAYDSCLLEY